MKRTYVAIVLDKSYSMKCLQRDTITAFNGMLSTLQDRASLGGETKLALVVFNDRALLQIKPTDPSVFPVLNNSNYDPSGNTALFDAVGLATSVLQLLPHGSDPDTSYLVVTITDGEENHSVNYDKRKFVTLIDRLQETNRWSFAFNVPRGHRATAMNYGIPADNIREWEQTSAGTQEMRAQTQSGLDNYFVARSAGVTATKSFYEPVTTDLSAVKPKVVAAKLDNVSAHFKSFEVKTEAPVKEFVEARTRKDYVIGQAYYMLMKSEKIQPQKAVLIVEKQTGAIFGGRAARDMIGLPGDKPAKVTPGNHSNYDVFVQSTSTNRKLPRGTKVLIDTAQTQSMTPTWIA